MSLAIGALSNSRKMGLKEEEEREGESVGERLNKQMSESSIYESESKEEEEEEEAAAKGAKGINLGPRVSIKNQLEKDKDYESLRRWKEQLLGSVDLSSVGGSSSPL